MKNHRHSFRDNGRIFLLTAMLVMLAASPVHAARGARAAHTGQLVAKAAIAMDLGTGRILYEQNADEAIPPASLTKVLTLYLAYEALQENRLNYTDTVLVSREATQESGSRMSLKPGERVIVRELMKGIAVASGNDACVALAEHLSGGSTTQPFVEAMNHKARELGMTGTTFKNPNGLPADGQVTTARDMLKLSSSYLRRFPQSLTFHSMTSYVHNNHNHHNANRLLTSYEGVDGLKTGFIRASGYNNVVTAKRGEQRIIAVVLGARSPGSRAAVTSQLLNLSFAKLHDPAAQGLAVLEEKKGRGTLPATLASRAPVQADDAPAAKPAAKAAPVQVAAAPVASQQPGTTPELRAAQRLADAKANQLAQGGTAEPEAKAGLVQYKNAQGNYAIQESSFQSREKAQKRAKHLVKKGLPVKVVLTKLDGKGKYYRVLVGPYANADDARKTREKLIGHGSVTIE
jgi:D-alanyl-D-alanine carboxypeptidase